MAADQNAFMSGRGIGLTRKNCVNFRKHDCGLPVVVRAISGEVFAYRSGESAYPIKHTQLESPKILRSVKSIHSLILLMFRMVNL